MDGFIGPHAGINMIALNTFIIFVSMNTYKAKIYGIISGLVSASVLMPLAMMMPPMSLYMLVAMTAIYLGLFAITTVLEEKTITLNLRIFTITFNRNLPETPKLIFVQRLLMDGIIPSFTMFMIYNFIKSIYYITIEILSNKNPFMSYILELLWQTSHQMMFIVIGMGLTAMWLFDLLRIRGLKTDSDER